MAAIASHEIVGNIYIRVVSRVTFFCVLFENRESSVSSGCGKIHCSANVLANLELAISAKLPWGKHRSVDFLSIEGLWLGIVVS